MAALAQIVSFRQFDGNNDPYCEHDLDAVYRLRSGRWTQERPRNGETIAATVFWKLDYYDNSLTFGSDAPWDAQRTKRVLAIMLASEY